MKYKLIVGVLAIFLALKMRADKKPDLESYHGKRVIVTGASQNIGEQIVYEYCERGAKLFITARRKNKLQEVQNKCMELGALSCEIYPLDMSQLEEIPKFIKKAVDSMGGIDILVLNHIMRTLTLEWTNSKENLNYLDQSIRVNYLSYVHLSSYADEYLSTSNGQLVFVSSLAGSIKTVNMTAYGATKAALNRFYDNLRYEMLYSGRNDQYTITCCMLGLIDTSSDYSRQRKVTVKAYPVQKTAEEIIEAGMMRQREVFIPKFTKTFHLIQRFLQYKVFDSILLKFTYGIDTENLPYIFKLIL